MDKERSGERMKLGAFFHPTGNHAAAWLHAISIASISNPALRISSSILRSR